MQAYFLTQYGPAQSAFQLRDVDRPRAGEGHVLIQSEAFGLNFAEVMARRGMYPDSPELPFIPGYDLVGRVVEAGPGVDPKWIGKRVAAMTRFGSYAEYCVTSLHGVAEIPEEMPAGEAAALCVQYATAWHCAMQCLNLRPGNRVLVHAAAGGVGTALVQICKWQGCEVFGTAGSDEKCQIALDNGADHMVNYRATDYAKALNKVLGRNRLDATFNAVAGKTFKKDLKLLGAGGRLVLFGAASRTNRKRGKWGTVRLLGEMGLVIPLTFIGSSKGVIGVNILRIADYRPQLISEALTELVKLCNDGVLKPRVGAEFTFDQLAEAHDLLESRKSSGKIIVKWDSEVN